jgi:hypothetical protein
MLVESSAIIVLVSSTGYTLQEVIIMDDTIVTAFLATIMFRHI